MYHIFEAARHFLEVAGDLLETMIAGFFGSLLFLIINKPINLLGWVVGIVTGVVVATYCTTLVLDLLNLHMESSNGIAFGLGFLAKELTERGLTALNIRKLKKSESNSDDKQHTS